MSTHGVAVAATDHETETNALPETIDSPEAKLVYHSLDAAGPGDAETLATRLNLGKMALFSVLNSLQRDGLIEREDGRYCAT